MAVAVLQVPTSSTNSYPGVGGSSLHTSCGTPLVASEGRVRRSVRLHEGAVAAGMEMQTRSRRRGHTDAATQTQIRDPCYADAVTQEHRADTVTLQYWLPFVL